MVVEYEIWIAFLFGLLYFERIQALKGYLPMFQIVPLFRQQPRAFHMIFMLEIWERFGYYTVQGILTLYFIRFLGLSEVDAYYTFGAFFALVYGMVALGGYLGDSVLGTKRTLILGLVVLSLGYLGLAFSTRDTVYWALALICVGNGLFKANPSNLLSKCYAPQDTRLHAGFTLYYMAVNLGSTFALLAGPLVAARFGYMYAYFLSFIGMLLGLLNYWYQRQHVAHINNLADKKPVSVQRWLSVFGLIALLTLVSVYLLKHVILARDVVWCVSALVLGAYCIQMRKQDQAVRWRMMVALILMVEAIGFFILYQQMPTSLTLFAVNNVLPEFWGIRFDPQSFQALNPFWIIVLSPLLAQMYLVLNKNKINFSMPYKFAAGMLICGIGFIILYFARFAHDAAGAVSPWWLVIAYLFISLGELFVSALGLAMVAELVPPQIAGFVMGMWHLSSAISGFLGAAVASVTVLPEALTPGMDSLMIYTEAFLKIGLVSLAFGLIMWFLAKPLTRYLNPEVPIQAEIPTSSDVQLALDV